MDKRTKRFALMLTEAEFEWLRERAFQDRKHKTEIVLDAVRAVHQDFPREPSPTP